MTTSPRSPVPPLTRVVHPLRYRRLRVSRVEPLAPTVRRIVLAGQELHGFVTAAFDDHVKVFFPDDTGRLADPVVTGQAVRFPEETSPPPGRDFTPRAFDLHRGELTIDFGLHGHGPATRWAMNATVGATVGVAGPRGSHLIAGGFDWHLLIGDVTALPAIARRMEEWTADSPLLVVAQTHTDDERTLLPSRPGVAITWVDAPADAEAAVEHAVAGLELPPGEGFCWVAGEASMARRVRQHLLQERRRDARAVKAAAYWRLGDVSRHELLED